VLTRSSFGVIDFVHRLRIGLFRFTVVLGTRDINSKCWKSYFVLEIANVFYRFEHIYRHHRRYRITEGSEEIQQRKIAAYLFGYVGPRKAEMSKL
jgi:hypothetical protein